MSGTLEVSIKRAYSGRGGVLFLRIIIGFENLVSVRCCLLCPELSVFWPKLRWGLLKLVKACEA